MEVQYVLQVLGFVIFVGVYFQIVATRQEQYMEVQYVLPT